MQGVQKKGLLCPRFIVTTTLILALALPAFGWGARDPGQGVLERLLRRTAQWIVVALDTFQVPTGNNGG